jgi:predicted GNAT family acetyltransferase
MKMNNDSAATGSPTAVVRHEPALARYTLQVDGVMAGIADYEVDGTKVLFTHVEMDPARRGQGLASILVRQAFDDVRVRTDLTVVPVCPYVVSWIAAHAEYQDLLTRGK